MDTNNIHGPSLYPKYPVPVDELTYTSSGGLQIEAAELGGLSELHGVLLRVVRGKPAAPFMVHGSLRSGSCCSHRG